MAAIIHASAGSIREPQLRLFSESSGVSIESNASPLLIRVLGKKPSSCRSSSSARKSHNTMTDPLIPSAASGWTKATLDVLNASYDRHHVHDFFENLEIPEDLERGTSLLSFPPIHAVPVEINTAVNDFTSVNNSNRITPQFAFNPASCPRLFRFSRFYKQLRLIMSSENTKPIDLPTSPTPPTQLTSPVPPADPTTPPAKTNPADPQYSGSSGGESKDEHFTNTCVFEYVSSAHEFLEPALAEHIWYRGTDCVLAQVYMGQH